MPPFLIYTCHPSEHGTITFDKLSYVESLKAAGVSEQQAKAHANALDDALRDSIATKADVQSSVHASDLNFAAVKSEILVLKWMMGFLLTGVASLIVKVFF